MSDSRPAVPDQLIQAYQSLRREGMDTRDILEMLDSVLFNLDGLPDNNPAKISAVYCFSLLTKSIKDFHSIGTLNDVTENIRILLSQMETVRNENAQQTHKMYTNKINPLLKDTEQVLGTQQQIKSDILAFEKHLIEQLISIIAMVKQAKEPDVKSRSQDITNQIEKIKNGINQYARKVNDYIKAHNNIKRELENTYDELTLAARPLGIQIAIPAAGTELRR